MTVNDLKSTYDRLKTRYEDKLSLLKEKKKYLEQLNTKHKKLLKCRVVIDEAARQAQLPIEREISKLVTLALHSIPFEDRFDFKFEFVKRADRTECDQWLIDREGNKGHPLDGTGAGGECDIISLAELCIYNSFTLGRKSLVIDEPLRNLSVRYHADAGMMIKTICQEFDEPLQIIMVTHNKAIIECADNVIKLGSKGDV